MTSMTVRLNYVDAAVLYQTTAADYIAMDLTNDYLIWTKGDTVVKDLMTAPPTSPQLNTAAEIISAVADTTVTLLLLYDYSHNVGGAYYTHKILKDASASDDQRYVVAFSFDGATATEPQLEAWDTNAHTTANNYCLGAGTPANSFVKAVCTNLAGPGAAWAGTAIAGANVLLLNNGNGYLAALATGITSQELYCNLKMVIPTAYATAAAETFVLTCRYTYV